MSTRYRRTFVSLILTALIISSRAAHATFVIDTTWNDHGDIFNFGSPNSATYGQVITVPGPDTGLLGFTLYLRNRSLSFAGPAAVGSGTLDVQGFVAGWDGHKATNLLYSGGIQTMNAVAHLQAFHYNTGGIALNVGGQYVLFLTTSGLPPQPLDLFGAPDAGTIYGGGSWVYSDNGALGFNSLFTTNWVTGALGNDSMWFQAVFGAPSVGAVPEPPSVLLLISGIFIFEGFSRFLSRKTSARIMRPK